MDLVTQKESEDLSMTALRRPETLDLILLGKGQFAFFCFKAFQRNRLQVSFYTALMHYFQCLNFYMWRSEFFYVLFFLFQALITVAGLHL